MATLEYIAFKYPDLVTKFVNENKVDVVSITHNKNDNVFVIFYTEETLAKENEAKKAEAAKSGALSPQKTLERFKRELDPRMIEAVNNLLAKHGSDTYITLMQSEIVNEYHRVCRASGKRAKDPFKDKQMDFEEIFRDAGWSVNYDSPGWDESYEAKYEFSSRNR